MFDSETIQMLIQGIGESLEMTLVSSLLAYVIGLPLGILLVVTDKGGLKENKAINGVVGVIVNITRSIPFLILLLAIIPFTRLVVGTSIGTKATIVPLVISAAPYVARLVESSLKEVDAGVIEAAKAMGSSNWQIISRVLVPEAKPSLLVGAAIAVTTILGYSAMAGFVGGGGLGTIAINYGYYRWEGTIMVVTIVLLVIIVQLFQTIGLWLANKLDKRK